MSRYNHFSKEKYQKVRFGSLSIGDKFRMDKRKGNIRRKDIVMVKTGDKSYKEFISKKEYTVFHSAFDVSEYSLITPSQVK